MLTRLVGFSIRYRAVVLVLACMTIGYGLYTTARAKYDVFPEFAPPRVVIQTEAPGLSPEEVEALVTRPVENAVNGIENLESLRSQSIQGLSVVTAVFREETDIFRARQMVSERLVEAAVQMPQGVGPPAMTPLTSATGMILVVGLTSDTQSPMALRTFADWTVRPRLLGVPGVAKVVTYGGEVRQLQIQVLPERLIAYGLALNEVVAAARRATGVRGAGFVETGPQRIVIRTEGQSLTPGTLGEAVVARRGGMSIRMQDVAHVVEAPAPKTGDAGIMGRPGVLLILSSQFGANTMEVTTAAEKALDGMKPALTAEGIVLHPRLMRPAGFIETAMRNVETSLLLGGLLVAAVLFLFLFNLRTAFISLTAIPLSLLAAVMALDRMGVTINTMTLGGLAIAIGEVVDDAIIDVENIFRRLRENRASAAPRPVARVVFDASIEVRSAVVYATFIVILVFLPVLTMTGLQGRLFSPLATAYVLAVLASLLVALTVTPALSFTLLAARTKTTGDPPFLVFLKRGYDRLLRGVIRRPRSVIGAALGLCLTALAMLPLFGGAFLPEFREGHFIIHMSAVPGTSLRASLRLGRAVTQALLRNPDVRAVSQQAGRAEQADDTWGTHYSELYVDLNPLEGEEAEAAQGKIRDALAQFPGVFFAVKPFLTERMEETISGVTAEVAIKIFGNDLDMIDRKARETARALSDIPGAADVQIQSPPGAPQLMVRLLPERLKRFGFQPVTVLEAVQTAYRGTEVTQTYEDNRVFDVAVILAPSARRDPERMGALMLRNAEGALIPLREMADIYQTTGRYAVLHDASRRRQAVTCNVRGRDIVSFVAEARKKIEEEVVFPAGVYPVFTGAAEAQAKARRELLVHSGMAGVGIVLLLGVAFGNLRNLLLALANLPFALAGGVLAVFAAGGSLSVGSLVGFVTLFGITTRNSIMMISHLDHLVTAEGLPWGGDTVLRGASERLAPILMTALVTALGLLPLALGSGDPGREIEGPMALVILGGLATSTLLNLLVLPALALRYGRFGER